MLTDFQLAQLTNQSECHIHTHPRVDNFTFPHGAFSDSTDQTASVNTATAMVFNSTDINDGVELESNSRMVVPRAGVYNLQFSAQFVNTDSTEYNVTVWFRLSGTNVPNSSTMLTIPKKHGSGDGAAVAAWNFFVRCAKGDYLEIMWSTPSAYVHIEYLGPQVSPTRPAIPSVIATVSYVSDR